MSKPQFDAFFSKVMEDNSLRDKLSALAGSGDVQGAYAEVAKIAQQAGFDVTAEDVAAAQVSLRPKGKLSDADLERVAGGKGHDNCEKVCGTVCGEYMGAWMGAQ